MTRMFALLRVLGILALMIGGALVVHRVQAGPVAMTETTQQQTAMEQTRATAIDLERAKMSGLNSEEWQRYSTLLRGPRGLWTPTLDPIWVLGIHARTDDERRKYAEMAVQQEHARVAGELAFQKAYDDAFGLLYGDEPIIDVKKLEINRVATRARADKKKPVQKTSMKKSPVSATAEERILLFVSLKTECPPCDPMLPKLLKRAERGDGLDIYFVGADAKDNAAIQVWAAKRGIPQALVRNGRITLNYDQASLAQLRKDVQRVPQLMVRRGVEITDATPESLGL